MIVCVDTVVFIDILKDEYPETQEKLYRALENGDSLVTPVVTAAELMPQFQGNRKELTRFLGDHRVTIMELDLEAAFVASERWVRYLKKKKVKRCPACSAPVPGRDQILADFLIGGFALVHSDGILTRDRGIYKTYFNDLVKL